MFGTFDCDSEHYEPAKQATSSNFPGNLDSSKLKKKNRKIKRLKADLKDFQVLERYVKGENEVLKKQSPRLQEDNARLKSKNKKLAKLARKWSKKNYFLALHNKILGKKIKAKQKRKGSNVNISIGTATYS